MERRFSTLFGADNLRFDADRFRDAICPQTEWPMTGNTQTKRRVFVDAHPFFRCTATVTLSDKSTAQCGRRYNDDVRLGSGRLLCAQHAAMDPVKVKRWVA